MESEFANLRGQAVVISLGLIGAGTNNARIAGMLRNLSSYYYKDASLLFCVMLSSSFCENSVDIIPHSDVGQRDDMSAFKHDAPEAIYIRNYEDRKDG